MGSLQKDYYQILQVHPQAEPEVIQAAYRRLARKYHPDANGSDGMQMQLINEAYEVLSDPAQRRAYDLSYHLRGIPFVGPAAGPTREAPAVEPAIDWGELLRVLAPTIITLLVLTVLVIDLFRLGLRGVPEVTLVLLIVGWLVYRFGGLSDLWR